MSWTKRRISSIKREEIDASGLPPFSSFYWPAGACSYQFIRNQVSFPERILWKTIKMYSPQRAETSNFLCLCQSTALSLRQQEKIIQKKITGNRQREQI